MKCPNCNFELSAGEKCEEEKYCECEEVKRFSISGGLPIMHTVCGRRIKTPSQPIEPKPKLPILETLNHRDDSLETRFKKLEENLHKILDYLESK